MLCASRLSPSVNDDNIEKVKEIVLENRCVGIREIAEDLNISYGTPQYDPQLIFRSMT